MMSVQSSHRSKSFHRRRRFVPLHSRNRSARLVPLQNTRDRRRRLAPLHLTSVSVLIVSLRHSSVPTHRNSRSSYRGTYSTRRRCHREPFSKGIDDAVVERQPIASYGQFSRKVTERLEVLAGEFSVRDVSFQELGRGAEWDETCFCLSNSISCRI